MTPPDESRTGTVLLLLLQDPTNNRAWFDFEARYGRKIYQWCRTRGLQDAEAEDVAQVVLIKLCDGIRTYDPTRGRFRPWLRRIVHNALLDYRKQQGRFGGRGGSSALERLAELAAPEELENELSAAFDLEVYERARANIQERTRPRDWEIFLDLTERGASGKEVAARHAMKVTAVIQAKYRVTKQLKEELQRLQDDGPSSTEERQ
jgi:RNA polymerase sigma-70 factor (ECF subfamily)